MKIYREYDAHTLEWVFAMSDGNSTSRYRTKADWSNHREESLLKWINAVLEDASPEE